MNVPPVFAVPIQSPQQINRRLMCDAYLPAHRHPQSYNQVSLRENLAKNFNDMGGKYIHVTPENYQWSKITP